MKKAPFGPSRILAARARLWATALVVLAAAAAAAPADDGGRPFRPHLRYGPIPTTISPEARAVLEAAAARTSTTPGGYTLEYVQSRRVQQAEEVKPYIELLRRQWTASVETTEIADVPVLVVTPKGTVAEDRAGIYLHGGAYVFGQPFTKIPAVLASKLGMRVYCLDYRMAPEHPFPAGLDDAVAVYRSLSRRIPSDRIAVFGDSAGGGLTLAAVLKARDVGLTLPAAVALFSPWCDLTRTGDSFDTLAGMDPLLQYYEVGLGEAARVYEAGRDPADPLLSPINADFGPGFPPTLISTGTRDLFQSLCARLQRVLTRAGVDVRLNLWEGMWHDFENYPIPESDESLGEVAAFLESRLTGGGR